MRWLILILFACSSIHVFATEETIPLMEFGRGLPKDVFWSPDGDTIYVVTTLNMLWLYEADSLTTMGSFSNIQQASFSPDGRWLITQNTDQGWSLSSMTQTGQQDFLSVVFSPNGQQILIETSEHKRSLLNSESLVALVHQPDFSSDLTSIRWSADSQQLLGLTDGDRIDVLNLADPGLNHSLTLPDRHRYDRLEWSLDASHIVDFDRQGNARVWDASTGDLTLELPSTEERPMAWFVNWSTDSQRLFRCASDGSVDIGCHIYDASTGLDLGTIGGSADWTNYELGYSPDRKLFALSGGLFDARSGESVDDFGSSALGGTWRAWTQNSRYIAMKSWMYPEVYIYDVEQHKIIQTLKAKALAYDPDTLAWSPDNRHLITWGYRGANPYTGSGLITIWDTETGQAVRHIVDHVVYGAQMSFNSDASLLAASNMLGDVAIFDTATGQQRHLLTGHEEGVTQMAWQPGGMLLATSDVRAYMADINGPAVDGNIVQVWDADSGVLIATLEHGAQAFSWHPSGDRLIMEDATGLYSWTVSSGEQQRIGDAYNSYPFSFHQWSEDGAVLMRGYYRCSHTGPAFDLYDASTLTLIAAFGCVSGRVDPVWWSDVERYVVATPICDNIYNATDQDCYIDVRLLADRATSLLDDPTSIYSLEQQPAYIFGTYNQILSAAWSPDHRSFLVVSDTGADLWALDLKGATFISSFPGAVEAVWSLHRHQIALATSEGVTVVDVATGKTIFERKASQSPQWLGKFLVVCAGDPCIEELWDVNTNHLMASGDNVPTIVSPDSRFGVETHTGMLRLWSLDQ